MAANERDAGATAALLAETRRRAACIDRYVDMIPAHVYLGSEIPAVQAARKDLDPARAKSTSQLVREAAAAAAGEKDQASGKTQRQQRKKAAGDPKGAAEPEGPSSRKDLHEKLEARLAELREERRRRQSAVDKARGKAKAAAAAGGAPAKAKGDGSTLGRRGRPAAEASDDSDAEAADVGALSFDARGGELPFEATLGKKGRKVKKLRADLRRLEADSERLRRAEARGEGDDVRKDIALKKALQRARGEKVHDDSQKLRKAQKALEMKKKKGKEKWQTRVDNELRQQDERQAQRKENLAKKSSGKRKNQQRSGFEGKHNGFLGS